MPSSAGVEVQLLGNGDVRVLIDATGVGTSSSFEIDLLEKQQANDPYYGNLRKFRIGRVHSTITSGSATTHNPKIESASRVQFLADDLAGIDVDCNYAEMFFCYAETGVLTFSPQVDAGDDNVVQAEILISAGWRQPNVFVQE